MVDPVALDYLEYLDPYLRKATWELYFCFIPRRCVFTNKRLWLCKCYRGLRIITGPGSPVKEYYYASTSSFMLWALR